MLAKTLVFIALALGVAATLDPAKSNTKGKYPKSPGCSRDFGSGLPPSQRAPEH
jgi:hypothetical protein